MVRAALLFITCTACIAPNFFALSLAPDSGLVRIIVSIKGLYGVLNMVAFKFFF